MWHRWAATGGSTRLLPSWTDALCARIDAAGARLLFRLGGTVAAEMATWMPGGEGGGLTAEEAIASVRHALAWIEEAERFGPGPPLPIAVALATDAGRDRSVDAEAWPALSRAQLLCNHARPGELILDARMRSLCWQRTLFVREIESEEAEGASLDRRRPFRSTCTASLSELRQPPLPTRIEAYLDEAAARVEGSEPRTLILRGVAGTGATELAGALLLRAAPPAALWLGSVPGAHAPLGSLRASLIRDYRSPQEVEAKLEARGLSSADARVFGRVAEGEIVERGELCASLRGAVEALARGGVAGRDHPLPWILLAPVSGIDPATLESLIEARRQGALFHLLGLQRADARLPRLLREAGEPSVLALPRLTAAETVELVRESLGLPLDDPMPEEIAPHAADTLPGLREALRALIAGGDLIRARGRWSFRVREPGVSNIRRPGADPLERRLALLTPEALLSLQGLGLLAEGAEAREVDSLLEDLGLGDSARREAWEDLLREGLVEGSPPLPSSAALRFAALAALDPPTRSRLHRAAAVALGRAPEAASEGWAGELAWHWEQAGEKAEAASLYLLAARAAQRAGFHRAAARAAKSAHALTPKGEAKEIEALLRRSLSALYGRPGSNRPGPGHPGSGRPGSGRPGARRSERPSQAPPKIHPFASRFAEALRRGKRAEAEQMLEVAMAEGGDLSAIASLKAAAALSVGDLGGAARAATRASRARGGAAAPRGAATRAGILEALIALAGGAGMRAVRAALGALAEARERSDALGESASLATLSLCLRHLGRTEDAMRLRAYALHEPL